MEHETHYTLPHLRSAMLTTTITPPPPTSPGEGDVESEQEDEYEDHLLMLSKPAGCLVQLLSVQMELISTSLLSLVSFPLLSLLAESQAAPVRLAHGGAAALRRLTSGLLGAAYVCAALLVAMVLAVLFGVTLVRLWVEDPVSFRYPLYFDYTHPEPTAAISVRGAAGSRGRAIPAGHAVCVSLVLLMPESDYNRQIGIFQLATEVISSKGEIIATSSQPCMLRFRSLPVQLMRTFVMGIPLLVGITDETQKILIEILRYREVRRRTEVIRVRLRPRAGTSDVPQVYEAAIAVRSRLPRTKQLVHNWKWTFYVWISLYMYVIILIVMACCVKPFALPRGGGYAIAGQQPTAEVDKDRGFLFRGRGGGEISDALRRWRDLRSKMKVRVSPELHEGSASSPAAGGEASEAVEVPGDFATSESMECVGD